MEGVVGVVSFAKIKSNSSNLFSEVYNEREIRTPGKEIFAKGNSGKLIF